MTLPNDVSRCAGHVDFKPNGVYWRPECVECQRRIAAPEEGQTVPYIQPPKFEQNCELRLEKLESQ